MDNDNVQKSKEKRTKRTNPNEKEKTFKEKYVEMKEQIKLYHKELSDCILNGKRLVNQNFKTTFFHALENLVKQLDLIKDEGDKVKKINLVYDWYKQRTSFFHDLNPIDKFTAKRYFETLPDISHIKKSEIFEARNYPVEYEKDHRTEIGGMIPPKDRLKEYLTKKINPKNIKKHLDKAEKDKDLIDDDQAKKLLTERAPSAHSSVAASTHYSTNFSTTGNKFFNQTATNRFLITSRSKPNVEPIDYQREIKTSHGYHRPAYEAHNLELQKQWQIDKNREINDKRHNEEVKEFINDWAFNKSRLKEEVERKQELKLLLKNYEKINIKPETKQFEEEHPGEGDEKHEETNKQMLEKEYPNEDTAVLCQNRNCLTNEAEVKTNGAKILNLKRANIAEIKGNVISTLPSRFEKNFPLEVTANLTSNKISTTRKIYGHMMDVPEIDNLKPGEYHSNYKHALSLYDNYNELKSKDFKEKKAPVSINHKIYSGERPATVREDVSNPLKQRRTLSAFNNFNELKELKNDLNKVNVSIPLKTLKDAFSSPDTKNYPKYYLPQPGFGFLKNPIAPQPKGKRPRSRKI